MSIEEETLLEFKYLEKYLDKISTVREWAEFEGHNNLRKFRRTILRKYGITPIKILNQLRINKAKHLLSQNNEMSCYEIALLIGLKDEKDLNNFFYYHEGIPPTFYKSE